MRVSELAQFCGAFGAGLTLVGVTEKAGVKERMAITRVGHHNPPATIDDGAPVELFAEPGNALSVGDVASALGSFPQGSDIRVAVPTDEGHHRCLAIHGIGFGAESGANAVELTLESWDSPHWIIRSNGG